ncbi:MAG: ABC transporter substrate-binding protein [Thermodesulfobacteriota bacterium]|nr:ABC transporter substrate-binding protein [Thermodesulfobacteriota bacterium]
MAKMNLLQFRCTLLIGVTSLLLFICACSIQGDEETRAAKKEGSSAVHVNLGGIYRSPLMNNPSTLDPAYVQDQYGVAVTRQLFNGLVQFGPDLMVLPALAKTWQVEENGKAYRFFLRPNARFHNNRPVTIHDVAFSISRLLRITPPPVILPHLLKIEGALAFRNHKTNKVDGLQAINDHVLLIRLNAPHVPFLTALGMYQAAIVSKKEVKKSGEKYGQNPIGSGPFRFVSWEKDKSIRLQRFSDYYDQAAFLDEIHYRIYPGGQIEDALSDFKKGNLDEMLVYGNIRQELSSIKDLQWFHRPSLSLLFYGIRGDHSFLKNPYFRKALSVAIDREKIIKEVAKGQLDPARTILPPGMPVYHQTDEVLVDDLKVAQGYLKRALEQETGPIPPVEIVSAIKSSFAIAELNLIKRCWARLGIPLKIKFITNWKEFKDYIQSDAVQIYRYAWFADIPDPDSFLYPLFASDSPVNFMHFKDSQVDKMLLAARGIVDPVKRAEMYQKIEILVLESSPIIPLLYLSVDRVYQSDVQGINLTALGAHTMALHRIWLKGGPIRK